MKIPKFILILILVAILGGIAYIAHLKNSLKNTNTKTTSIVDVVRGDIDNSINQTGKAALANEQKLRFPQGGKVTEIFVKTGDRVEVGQVLASLDKREFYQELSRAQDRIKTTEENIAKEIEKSHGTESRKLEREIASMERKLAEMEEDLSRVVQNSPFKVEEKKIEINTKKRELESLKNKYKNDLAAYETEEKNQEKIITSKIEESEKSIRNAIQNMSSDYADMRNILRDINKIFAFNHDGLTSDELSNAFYISRDYPGLKTETHDLWRDAEREIRDYNDNIFRINKNSTDAKDAEWVISMQIRVYNKLLETTDAARLAIDASLGDGTGLTASEISSLQSTISGIRSTIQGKISSLKTTRDEILLLGDSEKIRQKIISELADKKLALETLADNIKKTENQITQDERSLEVTANGLIRDSALQREIADKQSAILDHKDNIVTKKEELAKMLSGKSETLDNLRTTLKDQKSELEKMKTKEESYEIRAPFAGEIRAIKIKVGDIIGSESADAEKNILLENSDIINIKLALNQLDITKVSIGQEAMVSFEALDGAMLDGKITEISSTPTSGGEGGYGGGGASSTTYEVTISAERGEHSIYSGMDASVTITLDTRSDVLLVPLTAVSSDMITGESFVNVVEDGGNIKKTIVLTGETSGSRIEITEGLTEWQKIQIVDFNANNYKSDDFTSDF